MLRFSRVSLSKVTSTFCYYTNQTTKLINTRIDDDTGCATVTLTKPPANVLNMDIVTELSTTLTFLETQKVRGMILTSCTDKIFCAGLDLMVVYPLQEDKFKTFWSKFHDVWIQLYVTSFPTVAVINGHAPGGGCLLASSCEYRIMLRNFRIGFNETPLGFTAPPWVMKLFESIVGRRNAEHGFTTGQLYTTEQAAQIGLVDEIAKSKIDALERAERYLNKYEMISELARYESKKHFRMKDVEDAKNNYETDAQIFISMLMRPDVQNRLKEYTNLVKARKQI